MRLQHGMAVDGPVKGEIVLGPSDEQLTDAWAAYAVTDFARNSSKGPPGGELVSYAIRVEGAGAVYVCEGDVSDLDPAPTGVKVIDGAPYMASCHGAGLQHISLRSVPDDVAGQVVISCSTFTPEG